MSPRNLLLLCVLTAGAAVPLALSACDNSSAPHETVDSGTSSGGSGGGSGSGSGSGGGPNLDGGSNATPDAAPTCYTNPQTYVEIINACTDAAFVDKHPSLPLLQPDGSLPPLP